MNRSKTELKHTVVWPIQYLKSNHTSFYDYFMITSFTELHVDQKEGKNWIYLQLKISQLAFSMTSHCNKYYEDIIMKTWMRHKLFNNKEKIEAATRDVLYKKVFLEILQNSQENACARVSFLIRLQVSACNFIKKRTSGRCFPAKYAKFLRTTFL